jgi:hypothetical protein
VVTTFLTDAGPDEMLGGRGRYWMARLLLELGASYEASGDMERALDVYARLLDHGLPGADTARRRIAQIRGGRAAVDALN